MDVSVRKGISLWQQGSSSPDMPKWSEKKFCERVLTIRKQMKNKEMSVEVRFNTTALKINNSSKKFGNAMMKKDRDILFIE
jgi:hypothetical protein